MYYAVDTGKTVFETPLYNVALLFFLKNYKDFPTHLQKLTWVELNADLPEKTQTLLLEYQRTRQ